jgi:hypothetical protein
MDCFLAQFVSAIEPFGKKINRSQSRDFGGLQIIDDDPVSSLSLFLEVVMIASVVWV